MITEMSVRQREIPTIRYHRSSLIRQAGILTRGISLFERISAPEKFTRPTTEMQPTAEVLIFAQSTPENTHINAAGVIQDLRGGATPDWANIPAQVVRNVVQQVAEAQHIPASMLRYSELTGPSDFLNGNSLQHLYHYAFKSETRGDRSTVPFLKDQLQLQPTTDEVIAVAMTDRRISWSEIPDAVLGDVLVLAAEELEKHAYMLTKRDFKRRFAFLGNHTLSRLYNDANERKPEGQDTATYLLERAGLTRGEELKRLLHHDELLPLKHLPTRAVREVLEEAAVALDKPAITIFDQDLDQPIDAMQGAPLRRLLQSPGIKPDNLGSHMTSVIHKAELDIHLKDIKEASQKGHKIFWDRIPPAVIREVLEEVGRVLLIPAEALEAADLKQKYHFLGWKSLESLYQYINKKTKNIRPKERPIMSALKEYVGLHDESATGFVPTPRAKKKVSSQDRIRRFVARNVYHEGVTFGELLNIADEERIPTTTLELQTIYLEVIAERKRHEHELYNGNGNGH